MLVLPTPLAPLSPIDPLALHCLGPLTHPSGLGPVHAAVEGHHGAAQRGVVIVLAVKRGEAQNVKMTAEQIEAQKESGCVLAIRMW